MDTTLTPNGGILTPLIRKNCQILRNYLEAGGYAAARKALAMTPEAIINEVTKSNLRGLGGAGFPTGRKWSFIPKNSPKPKYLVINADESEPGTFKDRYLITRATHALLEGIIIAARAIDAHTAYIYIRGEYVEPARILQAAIDEAYQNGILGRKVLGTDYELNVYVHRGAGAYICGEETALLESLEGKKGWPRMKPPFPAIEGLFRCPTIVNNVETISYVPAILANGGEWFAKLGSERNGGYRFYSVSGHVNRPGVYELPHGTTLREILYTHAGGIRNGKKLKAVIPGGSSSPVLRPEEIDVKMDVDSLAAIGSMIGSAGVIAIDEDTCLLEVLRVTARFYHHESCGQCTPCREGTGWLEKVLARMRRGEGNPQDPDRLLSIATGIMGNTICPLGDAAAMPVFGFVKKFREEFEAHARYGRCHTGAFTSWQPPARPGA
ncbi:MAG: NADH-quinone oxidoreductase subunit NuoF [candidate division KSB1 bacterium]|nr:NADH-quinone oxidoreductase subunit NuoF [candidate division KSB1 bacterium]MDZ7272685.1 NADH-quinone oxidoreductase subunit NuoF [candidate division KSB1 bacterium]MDZ7284293.1 NADH-quinone oxidoreductase subunit NuoF [candidate division KSB1 bacterium]MDZ7297311.1 NADH-quinone oxidoreductase subunit NuoF [candidate division KSB1 bacterium]MDZ7309012.1 NADH-quinone oxidoreductase subunit NuoF [candidate division KSB1 bacterium]